MIEQLSYISVCCKHSTIPAIACSVVSIVSFDEISVVEMTGFEVVVLGETGARLKSAVHCKIEPDITAADKLTSQC